jgi:hypothetical protein
VSLSSDKTGENTTTAEDTATTGQPQILTDGHRSRRRQEPRGNGNGHRRGPTTDLHRSAQITAEEDGNGRSQGERQDDPSAETDDDRDGGGRQRRRTEGTRHTCTGQARIHTDHGGFTRIGRERTTNGDNGDVDHRSSQMDTDQGSGKTTAHDTAYPQMTQTRADYGDSARHDHGEDDRGRNGRRTGTAGTGGTARTRGPATRAAGRHGFTRTTADRGGTERGRRRQEPGGTTRWTQITTTAG